MIGGNPEIETTVPRVFLKSRLERPRPNKESPIPLMPCSAWRVTLTSDMSRPIKIPTRAAARTPSQRLPVVMPAKKPAKAPIIIIPSTPRLSTPEAWPKVSPIAA